MPAPKPLFVTSLAQPLEPRLSEGAVIAQACVVASNACDPGDPRLAIPDDHSLRFIAHGAVTHIAVAWPDGVLSWAYIPGGNQVLHGMRSALLDAYARGRNIIEQIHLQHGGHAGNA